MPEITLRRVELKVLTMCLSLNALLTVSGFIITIFSWGVGQALTPMMVERKLSIGMTMAEAASALAIPSEAIENRLEQGPNGTLYAYASHAGMVGIWFVPQHEITLVFGKDRRLVSAFVYTYWRADEYYMELNISHPRRS